MGETYDIWLSSPDITRLEKQAVRSVLDANRLSLGPKLPEFERAVARYTGVKYAVAVNSGTSALHLLVRALDLGPGDEVITSPFSFVASSNCVLFERAKPVFCDIDPRTLNLDPEQLEHRITSRTRAVIAVDVFGHPADWPRLTKIARRRGLALIEDSCEALGAELAGRKAGSFGRAGVFAFYPNKQITTGEGGVITTDDRRIADLCTSMRNQGRDPGGAWLTHARLGYNYRLNEMSCALGLAQLSRIGEILEKRDRVARAYRRTLGNIEELELPYVEPGVKISWFVYVVRLRAPLGRRHRDALALELKKRGIQTNVYFSPIHLQPFYRRQFGFRRGDFPVTENVSDRTLALPFYNNLSAAQIRRVAESLKEGLVRVRRAR